MHTSQGRHLRRLSPKHTHTLVVIIVVNVVQQSDLEGAAVYVHSISMCIKDDALFAPVSHIAFVLFPN